MGALVTVTRKVTVNDSDAIPYTIRVMGDAIRNASTYLPLRNHAASLASLADPHDYLGQVQNVYNDVITHWRYVRDPEGVETVTVTPPEIMQYVLGFNGGVGRGYGAGDCDDITIAAGALLQSIGLPVRIVTTAEYDTPDTWTHVFLQVDVPGYGWITFDPVLHPAHKLGGIVDSPKYGIWSLDGNYMETLKGCTPIQGYSGLAGTDLSGFFNAPQINEPVFGIEEVAPGNPYFGCAIRNMGYIGNANNYTVELGSADYLPDGSGRAITPILAFSPDDFDYIKTVGCPYPGMKAIGNTGYVYEYVKGTNSNGLQGPIINFFKRIGRGIRNFFSTIWNGVKKVFEATKFGRWVLKVVDGVIGFAVKIVKPLAQFVGKYAPALAPVAALIPGIGIPLAGYLLSAGGIAKVFNQFGVPLITVIQIIDGEEVELQIPQFENIDQAINVKTELLNTALNAPDITPEEITAIQEEITDLQNLTQDDLDAINESMEEIGMDFTTGATAEQGQIAQLRDDLALQQMDMTDEEIARTQAYLENVNPADPYGELLTPENVERLATIAQGSAAARANAARVASQQAAARAMYERANSPEVRAAAAAAQNATQARYNYIQTQSRAAAARAAAERGAFTRQQLMQDSFDFLQNIGFQISAMEV